MPGVVGRVEWEVASPQGAILESGGQRNLFLDQGRSAYIGVLRLLSVSAPRWFQFGTGSAAPAITDSALQFRVTALSATALAFEADFTARISTQLGNTQMTGLITELLLGTNTAATNNTAWAKAAISATHYSGTTMTFHWRLALHA